MKEKFPHFPHSSKTTVKEWDSELLKPIWAGEQVHHISTEIGKYYPYCFYIDEKNNRIAFLNRAYKPIKKSCRGDKVEYWFKFDVKKFKNFSELVDDDTFLDTKCKRCFMSDKWDALDDEHGFNKYMQRLNYLESCMLEVSPFMQRFALTIKRAYELKQENEELKRKLDIATERNKFLDKILRKNKNLKT